MYRCEILADSKNLQGDRITTMKITFPRIVLAEFNTHRMFSRNSASSRAIPFKKMVQMVQDNPFIPLAWQKDHRGMQGNEYFDDVLSIEFAKSNWLTARDWAVMSAKSLHSTDNGYGSITKQLCNRLLEPFMWHTVIVTATEWENFFNLRCPQYEVGDKLYKSKKDALKNTKGTEFHSWLFEFEDEIDWLKINKSQAEIHIQAIAELMWDAYNESTPKVLESGEWHIPFGDKFDEELIDRLIDNHLKEWPSHSWRHVELGNEFKTKIATARCARISYETLGDDPKIDYEADIKLHDILAKSGHWSPFEHVAVAMDEEEYESYVKGVIDMYYDTVAELNMPDYVPETAMSWCRNFRGFIQYRYFVDR